VSCRYRRRLGTGYQNDERSRLLGNVFGALNQQAAEQTQAMTASSMPALNVRIVSLVGADPTGSTDENVSLTTETKTDAAGRRHHEGPTVNFRHSYITIAHRANRVGSESHC
jgi:hypothetical protein